MALSVRLDLKQSQTLVMTPQLQQAIKLLQMSNLELGTFVEEELERNPLLQRDESENAPIQETVEPEGNAKENASDAPGLEDINLNSQESSNNDSIDADVDNQWSSDTPGDQTLAGSGGLDTTSYSKGGGTADGESFDWAQNITADLSLRDHLIEQINLDLSEQTQRIIAAHMVEFLDESGYFTADLEEMAESLSCEKSLLEDVLTKLQRLDPVGIFARSLSECLALQLKEKDRFDPAMEALVDNLDLLGKRDFPALLKLCGIDEEDLSDMIAEIQALDPRPALAFDTSEIQAVTPDIMMKQGLKGKWLVELNSENLPKVLVNNSYYAEVSQLGLDKESKHYISECFQTANWLVKSLHQRATTILKVSTEIVRQQDMFFKKGVEYLKPIVLRDIADAVEMHESTVSRVTSNKYIATPRGIYELKYFFTSAINSSEGGDAHSAESVKFKIKRLIDDEDPKKILSDDKLVQHLKNEGIDIARRTVAKYREALGIASSVQRRREKKALLGK
ncbi:RNA polymerase, sigma 54 (sigma N) factor [Candidatus Terasakiella magnetica]|uniref:RNA polymerase sigma-54 factor n=1 Tax=Candidatus Terasakiella magnetica TaxID=1867952 RepID=A0A1C3RE02_9PROT|nr:RNA polymerase factor sigma-54 [Candidatus Terasakiella magnetica]SCA55444.1 RNA polymerase, sigma 54 (sigma N) factor [Candidatus Terasakiella magnetica]